MKNMHDGELSFYRKEVKKAEEIKFGDRIKELTWRHYLGRPTVVETSEDKPRLWGWRTLCPGVLVKKQR